MESQVAQNHHESFGDINMVGSQYQNDIVICKTEAARFITLTASVKCRLHPHTTIKLSVIAIIIGNCQKQTSIKQH
jgi:hypothetical protein